MNIYKNKVVLVTGGTGSIGTGLVKKLLTHEPTQVRIFSRDESKQYQLQEELDYPKNLRLLIGDIRNRDRLDMAFQDVNYIFHAAAMKHVPFCEYNPFEAVRTNIIGSQNVIDMAIKNNVKKVIAISTDKAANPSNLMGVSKLTMEKLFVNANLYIKQPSTQFSCVRFGNVAWTRGSVLPSWKKQVERKSTIMVTEPDMTRFVMSLDEAVNLIMKASDMSYGGEIFVLKMPSIKLSHLAEMFINKYFPSKDIKIDLIGKRPGEKMHEHLFGVNDIYRTILEDGKMFIIIPDVPITHLETEDNIYKGFSRADKVLEYSSADTLDNDRVKEII